MIPDGSSIFVNEEKPRNKEENKNIGDILVREGRES